MRIHNLEKAKVEDPSKSFNEHKQNKLKIVTQDLQNPKKEAQSKGCDGKHFSKKCIKYLNFDMLSMIAKS